MSRSHSGGWHETMMMVIGLRVHIRAGNEPGLSLPPTRWFGFLLRSELPLPTLQSGRPIGNGPISVLQRAMDRNNVEAANFFLGPSSLGSE